MRRIALLVALAALGGCSGGSSKTVTAAKVVPAPPLDPWVLTTLDGAGGEPAYLSNGLIGVRVGRNGGGLDPSGKPFGFFMIDEYEPKGEEKIRVMPNPLLVTVAVGNELFKGGHDHDFMKSGGTPLDPRGGTDYRQALDMRTGVLTTSWKQAGVEVRCETAVHPSARALGQRWTLKAEKASSFSFKTLDYAGEGDPQKEFGRDERTGTVLTVSSKRAVSMVWKTDATTKDSGASAAIEGFRIQEGPLEPGKTATFERTLSFGAASALNVKDDVAVQKAAPRPYPFAEIAGAAASAWKRRWTSDIEIDGPVEDQQAVRSMLFYLRSSIAPGARRAVAPMALSSDIYGGHVFWDADIWMFPALMLTDPDLARQISEYRLDRLQAAIVNHMAWVDAGCPTATKAPFPPPKHPTERTKWISGAKYPWESSVSGYETVPGPSRYEDHITGSVAWGLSQGAALSLNDAKAVDNVIGLAARFYIDRSQPGPDGIEIKGTMSPDESHIGDNDLYTNLLASWLNGHATWSDVRFKLPRDATSFLTYDDDLIKSYKQTAAVLACYPLQYPPAEAQTKTMLERFAPKVIANGPAMTDSIHGLLWARVGEPDKGYGEWRKGWFDFTRHPLMMFSEKRKSARTYFATGAGGSLQSVLYGFAGLRLDYKKATDAAWSRPLAGGRMLSVKPSLPKEWKRVRLRGLSLPDGRYDFDISPGKVTVAKVQS